MFKRTLSLLAAVVILHACGDNSVGPPVTRVVVGVIEAGGTISGALSGPTTGVVGEPLTFRVTTWGSSCYHAAGASVINQGLQMTVIPYDSISAGICRDGLLPLARDVIVVFDRSGDVVLRLQGQSLVGRNPAVIAWPLQIRP
jgi:hypothetical protein